MIEFSFDNQKVTSIPIEEFMVSGRIVNATTADDSKVWDTPHVFFDGIRNILTEKGITYSFDPIHVSSEMAEYLADPLKIGQPKNELRRWAFKRLVTRILMGNDENYNPSIGLGFNENGLEMTIGTDVWVCRNMSIFGNYLMKSYGRDKMGMNELYEGLRRWIDETWTIHENNMRILGILRNINLSSKEGFERLIGQLSIAQNAVYCGVPMHAPMNNSEINEFSKRLIKAQPELVTEDVPMNLYEVYNHATNILTHSENNIKNKWTDLNEMGEFMIEHFQLN